MLPAGPRASSSPRPALLEAPVSPSWGQTRKQETHSLARGFSCRKLEIQLLRIPWSIKFHEENKMSVRFSMKRLRLNHLTAFVVNAQRPACMFLLS